MHFTGLLVLAALAAASPLNFNGKRGNLPTPVSIATAKTYLAELKVAPPVTEPAYERKKFQHWITISGKCDTRETVLKRDATVEVTVDSECKATAGAWYSDYDGIPVANATGLDIDHIVPLKEGWQAGAWNWTATRRKEFANDLIRPQLLAVSASSNRMKGDKDPSKWMPSNPSYRCTYIRAWIHVKHYYGLTVDQAEKDTLTEIINA
ncbi:unnamed protein product [Rhizoctonia solani]|uniref:GmrSD restriction endonucleases C-terminal domain-containing protein n=1 Tax=Rhizoctonia solani TaxID=456999 RepID=A0A8H3DZJ0_9AGAM|nr:unnamed protein product [Rhizoctonia solani]